MTVTCVLAACLFPGAGYDVVLAAAFGLPGLYLRPGTEVPAGPAFSKARKLLGEQVMKRLSELDAARSDADLGIAQLWKDLEITALDGTTMELFRNEVLTCEFGTSADGARPLLRITAHVRAVTRWWIAAAIGDDENQRAVPSRAFQIGRPLADRPPSLRSVWQRVAPTQFISLAARKERGDHGRRERGQNAKGRGENLAGAGLGGQQGVKVVPRLEPVVRRSTILGNGMNTVPQLGHALLPGDVRRHEDQGDQRSVYATESEKSQDGDVHGGIEREHGEPQGAYT